MDGDDPGTQRTVRHTDVPSELCLPFEEEADRNKETADLSARRLRLLGNIKAFAIIQRPEASQEIQDRVQRISQRCPRFSKK